MTRDMDVARLTGAQGRALSQTNEFCYFCYFKSRTLPTQIKSKLY